VITFKQPLEATTELSWEALQLRMVSYFLPKRNLGADPQFLERPAGTVVTLVEAWPVLAATAAFSVVAGVLMH
jgi:hypothetical protein